MAAVMKVDRRTGRELVDISGEDKKIRIVYGSPFLRFALRLFLRKPLLVLARTILDSPLSVPWIAPFARKRGLTVDKSYPSFNAFFSRPDDTIRFPPEKDVLGSPCEAFVSAWDDVKVSTLFTVKGEDCGMDRLLGFDSRPWQGGCAYMFRLETSHHHRVYLCDEGRIAGERSIPGRYDSGRKESQEAVPDLFLRNHRVVSRIDSRNFGSIAMVEVGAMMVGCIVRAAPLDAPLARGSLKGWFKFGGSTVLLFFQPGKLKIDEDLLRYTREGREAKVRPGEPIGLKISPGI